MNYYKMTLAFDGTNYCGWQIQANAISIHATLMRAGHQFLKDAFTITGCSRTDSGVHALGYVALLATALTIEPRQLCNAFNYHLPKDIVIYQAEPVGQKFHPRYSSISKTYRYSIYNNPYPIPQYLKYSYYYYKKLDLEAMIEAAAEFVGTYDFAGFSSIKRTVSDTVRTIYELEVKQVEQRIQIDITGNGFLYNMVRIIAGTLLEVGLGNVQPEQIKPMLLAAKRLRVNKTLPAGGLTLLRVDYQQ